MTDIIPADCPLPATCCLYTSDEHWSYQLAVRRLAFAARHRAEAPDPGRPLAISWQSHTSDRSSINPLDQRRNAFQKFGLGKPSRRVCEFARIKRQDRVKV